LLHYDVFVTEPIDPFVSFLNLSPWLLVVIIALPLGALMFGAFFLTRRRGRDQEAADFGKEALAIIAGGFVFIGAFAVVTSWNVQSALSTSITNEFAAATSLAEDMGDIKNPAAQELTGKLATYAESVRADEVGLSGVVGPTPEAQKQLAVIQSDVVSLANATTLTAYQSDNVFTHLEALKDARKARLAINLPNLPAMLITLILVSAALSLIGVSLYPPSRLVWIKYFYSGAALVVVTGLITTILVLQSPSYVASQVTYQIDMFTSSVSQGGANLEQGQPAMGDAPVPGNEQNPGPPDGGPTP
jgi:hypothetical protein